MSRATTRMRPPGSVYLSALPKQIREHLPQPDGVAVHDERIRQAAFQFDAFGLRADFHVRDFREQQRHEIHEADLDEQLAGRHAAHIEQIVDEPRLQPDVALDCFETAVHYIRARALAPQQVNPRLHRIERRAQFMRDVGEKRVLQLARVLRFDALQPLHRQEPVALYFKRLLPRYVDRDAVETQRLAAFAEIRAAFARIQRTLPCGDTVRYSIS